MGTVQKINSRKLFEDDIQLNGKRKFSMSIVLVHQFTKRANKITQVQQSAVTEFCKIYTASNQKTIPAIWEKEELHQWEKES